MSSSQRTHQERLSYLLNNRTTTIRYWKQPTNWQHQEARTCDEAMAEQNSSLTDSVTLT